MPPANVCPNCGEKEWLESPSLHYMPRLRSDEKGYSAELENGVNVSVCAVTTVLHYAVLGKTRYSWHPFGRV